MRFLRDEELPAKVGRFTHAPIDFVETALYTHADDIAVVEYHPPTEGYAITIRRNDKEVTASLSHGEMGCIAGVWMDRDTRQQQILRDRVAARRDRQ